MEFDRYYLVLLRKGPAWTPDVTPALEKLQADHLAHLGQQAAAGRLLLAGPVHLATQGDIRGVNVFRHDAYPSIDALQADVAADPAIKAGRLQSELMTWFVPAGSRLTPRE